MKKFATTAIAFTLTALGVACTPIEHFASQTQTSQAAKQAGQNLTKLISIDNPKEVTQLNYIENLKSPEDLVQIPNTKWIIASGMTHHSGLYLIDSQSKTAQRLITPKASAPSAEFKIGKVIF